MQDISQIIQLAIVIIILVFFITYAVLLVFYRGKRTTITIVRKYTNEYIGLNQTRTRMTPSVHLAADCRIADTGKIRTLACERSDIYNKLKTGKTYVVIVKLGHIHKIIR